MIVLLLAATPAWAQERPKGPGYRDGFWASVGGGYAVLRAACDQCGEDAPYRDRAAFFVEMGGVVSRHVLAEGEIFTQSDDVSGNATRLTSYMGSVRWYPGSRPIFIKFGFGLSRGRNSFVIDGVEERERTTGMGVTFGFGFDLRLTRSLSLSPVGSWYLAAVGDFETSAGLARSVSTNTWFAGVGLTLH